jgi:hypothetical protein
VSPTRKIVLIRILLTVLAGIAWPFVCGMIFLQIGYDVLVLQIQLLQVLGIHSGASLKTIIHISDAVLWAVVFGILFGLPLGGLVRRNVMSYWGLFLATVLLLVAWGEVGNGSGLTVFISELALSQFPIYQAGILVAWYLTAKVLSRTNFFGIASGND